VLVYILFFLSIVLSTLLSLWIIAVKMKNLQKDRAYMKDIREEMAEFMGALEDNVGGYVALMEKMRQEADTVMESVNRKLRLLEKESQKFENSKQTYSELAKRKPLVTSVVEIQKSSASRNEYENFEEVRESLSSSKRLAEQLKESRVMMQESTRASEPPRGKGNASKVAMLWREGKDAKAIAEQLNLSLGEVELALELMGSRRR
jgi:DNA repair ATPase RecN